MAGTGHLYCGINGRVVCVRRHDGKEIWRTKLRKGREITTLYIDDQLIFAACGGYLHAMERISGRIRWMNELKGLRHGIALMGTKMQSGVAAAQAAQAAQTVAMAAAAAVVATTAAGGAASSGA